MARAIYYPPASRSRWYNDTYSGADIEPNVLVWHTTETGGVPSYGGGASAPHLTYDPDGHDWYQHFRLDRSARALRNRSGGVETNTLNACQVEIVAYSDERLARERGHLPVSKLDDKALRDLGEFAAFMWDEWGLLLDIDPGWLYDDFDAAPMSFSEWRNFYGHIGHNRVPENTHWDPARLDIRTIIDNARGGIVSYNDVWRTDDKMRAPKGWRTDKNTHWWPESVLEHIGDVVSRLFRHVWFTDGQIDAPEGYPNRDSNPHWHPQRFLREIADSARYHIEPDAARSRELLEAIAESQLGASADEIKAHIDQRYNEAAAQRQALADRLDAGQAERAEILALVEAVGSGERDAADVVDEIARRLRGDDADT